MDVTTETFQRDVIYRSHELSVVVDFWAGFIGDHPGRVLGDFFDEHVLAEMATESSSR